MIGKHRAKLLPAVLLFLMGVALVVGCTPSHPMSTFDARGPVAQVQLDLFVTLFWIVAVVFVIVEGFLLYTLIRFRRKPGDGIPKQTHGNNKLEIALTIIPSILLLILAVPTISAQFYIADPPEGERLDIQVVAHQWWWQATYPESGVVTANELHVPIGMPVKVELQSNDVLHSFWIPKLAGKMDMVPGKTTHMWFQADHLDGDPQTSERDAYYGQCAEFCGQSHSWMRFKVFVDTAEEFEAWQENQLADSVVPTGQEAKAGATLFVGKGCIACHTISGVPGAVGVRGPDLTHVGGRSTLAAGILAMNASNLKDWLEDPEEVKPGNIMSREAAVYTNAEFALTGDETNKLVAYLQELK